ncbi:MAG: CotH kinase family protein [Clostridia bacterium]|nr:CotH kinase family protein [Clostridia bacterium]
MKKSIIITMLIVVFWGISAHAAPEAPVFSLNGGVYEEAIEVSLSGEGDIYYTLNGDVPTTSSNKYTEPFVIEPTTTTPPKGTVIRAAVIKDGETSYVSSNTYFVGEGMWDYVGNYPFVNLIATQYDLWDSSNGIYQNWSYEHKVPGVFHYITKEGQTEVNRTIEMKVSGNGSRNAAKKSLRVYFKKTDPTQSKLLEYDLIPGDGVDTYSKVTFRISDWQSTNLRDPLAQRIASHTRVDTAHSVPMVLFLNGEYWGLYECREQYDKDYLEEHYGIDGDNIVFFDRSWTMPIDYTEYNGVTYVDKIEYSEGPEDDNEDGVLGETYYRTQWAYVKSLVLDNDFTSDEVYEEFCSVVDVDNLIDYMIVYMHAGNDDWPGNNMKFWRVTEESIDPDVYGADGKWRFMVHDFDISYENTNHNTLYLSTMQKDTDTASRHPKFATDLFEGLFKNATFRNEFAQRSMVYLRTIMRGTSISAMLDEMVAEREAGKAADVARWSLGTLDGWKNKVNSLKSFASGRPSPLRTQYMDLFNTYYDAGITGTVLFNVSGDDCYISGGKVTDGAELKMFSGIPVTIEAEDAYISVTENGSSFEAYELLTFVPSADCEIEVIKAEGIMSAKFENGKITVDVAECDGKLYIAGYKKDGTVKFVKSTAVTDTVFDVDKANYYKVFVWDVMEPAGQSYKLVPSEDYQEDEKVEIDINVSDSNDNLLKDPYDDNFDPEDENMQ